MSHRQLAGNSTLVLLDEQVGLCRASGNIAYPNVGIINPNTIGTTLRDWCKDWCERVQPEKVIAIATYNSGFTQCYCFFDANDKPAGFLENITAFKQNYDPPAGFDSTGASGTGCVWGTNSNADTKCYRNCAYSQCVSIHLCFSLSLFQSNKCLLLIRNL